MSVERIHDGSSVLAGVAVAPAIKQLPAIVRESHELAAGFQIVPTVAVPAVGIP